MPLSFLLITIAIDSLQRGTVPMANTLDRALPSRDVEGACGTHSHFAHIRPDLLSRRDNGLDHISRLKALDMLGLFGSCAWKAPLIHQTHLPTAMSSRRDEHWSDVPESQV